MASLQTNAWNDFFARNGRNFNVYVDTRTGSVSGLEGVHPPHPRQGHGQHA